MSVINQYIELYNEIFKLETPNKDNQEQQKKVEENQNQEFEEENYEIIFSPEDDRTSEYYYYSHKSPKYLTIVLRGENAFQNFEMQGNDLIFNKRLLLVPHNFNRNVITKFKYIPDNKKIFKLNPQTNKYDIDETYDNKFPDKNKFHKNLPALLDQVINKWKKRRQP